MFSTQTQRKVMYEVMHMFIYLSHIQCIHISKHHVVHHKDIQFLFANLRKKKKKSLLHTGCMGKAWRRTSSQFPDGGNKAASGFLPIFLGTDAMEKEENGLCQASKKAVWGQLRAGFWNFDVFRGQASSKRRLKQSWCDCTGGATPSGSALCLHEEWDLVEEIFIT